MSDESKPAVFWGGVDEERLTHTEMDDAIESILDDTDKLPETIEVAGFHPMELPSAGKIADDILEDLLERFDDNYGDLDGSVADAETPLMRKAAEVFAAIFRQEYRVWACEIVERKTIDVHAWVKENRPDWLEDESHE